MDTEQNKQVVMEGYRLFQAGDIDGLVALYHDDAEWVTPESDYVPFSGDFHGKQGIAQFFNTLGADAQVVHFTPRDVIAEGDKVVVTGDSSWIARPTGRAYDSAWVHVFTLRDAKVSRFVGYFDTAACEKAFNPAQPGISGKAAPLHH